MLFFHNIIKRKKIQNYVFTLIGILLLLAILETVFLFIKNKRMNLINSEENRTIIFTDSTECNELKNYETASCDAKDDGIKVVFKTLAEKEKAEQYFSNKYDLILYSDQYKTEENVMGIILIASKFIMLFLAFIIIITEYMLIKEDKKVFSSLRSIGYSNKKIIFKTLSALNLFYLPLIIVAFILFLIVFTMLNEQLSNIPIINYVVLTYLIFFVYADIVYILLYKISKIK